MTPLALPSVVDRSRLRILGALKTCPLGCVCQTFSVAATASDFYLALESHSLEVAFPVQRLFYLLIHDLWMTASEIGIAPPRPLAAALAAGHGFHCV